MLNKNLQPNQRFGVIRNLVLECERLGYDSVWLDDHVMYENWPILECWTTLSALAPLTSRIRLGTMVTCSAHRHPALLAKQAATFDCICGGRLELGIGAGIQEKEHLAYGFGFQNFGERIERLAETLEITKRLWTMEKASFEGKHFSLKDAVCKPKPLQKPHPPLIVGGSSNLLLRKVTAPFADRFDWGLLPLDQYKRKLEVLEAQCRVVGRAFGEIEKSCWLAGQVLIAENQEALDGKVAQFKPANFSLDEFGKTTLAGTPEQCLEQLQAFKKLGVTYFMLYFADFPDTDGLRLFAEAVLDRRV